MSDYQDGYDQGYQDGLAGDHRVDTWIVDAFLGTTEREEEWRQGYEEGYADGERETNNS